MNFLLIKYSEKQTIHYENFAINSFEFWWIDGAGNKEYTMFMAENCVIKAINSVQIQNKACPPGMGKNKSILSSQDVFSG